MEIAEISQLNAKSYLTKVFNMSAKCMPLLFPTRKKSIPLLIPAKNELLS